MRKCDFKKVAITKVLKKVTSKCDFNKVAKQLF